MKRSLLTPVAAAVAVLWICACGGAAEKTVAGSEAAAPAAAPAAAAAAPAAADDAAKFAGKWLSDAGQMTQYVFEDGKLYVLLGSEKNECTLAEGGISYRAAGMTVRMKYRFVDDDTLEYTDPSMPNWSLVQKRQLGRSPRWGRGASSVVWTIDLGAGDLQRYSSTGEYYVLLARSME